MMDIEMMERVEGGLVRLCIEAASEGRESVEIWRRQRRTLERLPPLLADALFHRLLHRRLLFPSLLEVFQFCVVEVDLRGESMVDAEWMAYLGSFRHLRVLNLAECRNINNSSIWSITGMTSLEELDLSRCKITDPCMDHLLSLHNLKKLSIPETGVTPKGIIRLSNLGKLSLLNLGRLPITDVAIESLQVLTKLEYLDLWGSKVSNKGAEILEVFSNLNFLNLAWTNVTILPKLPSLACLNMSGCTIHSIFEGEEETETHLSKLLISGATFIDVTKFFSCLDWQKLCVLDMSQSTVEDFHFLEGMKRLEYLDVSYIRVTDNLTKSVACVGWNLKDLNLSHSSVGTAGIAVLAGKVPNLEILSLSHTAIDDNALSYIGIMPSLREINLSKNDIKGFIYEEAEHQEKILSLTALQVLDYLECLNLEGTKVIDEVMHPVSELRSLSHLSLKSDFLSDITLHALSSLPKLVSLGFRGSLLTNDGLLSFKPPPMLQVLDLRECWLLTEDVISSFCRSHPNVHVRHEGIQLSSIHQNVGSGSSLLRGPSRASQSRLRRGKCRSAVAPCSLQKNNFMDERIKYSREELLRLQIFGCSQTDAGALLPKVLVKD